MANSPDDLIRSLDPFQKASPDDDAIRAIDPFQPKAPAPAPSAARKLFADPLVDLTLGMAGAGKAGLGLARMIGGDTVPATDTAPAQQAMAGYFSPQRQALESQYEASKEEGLGAQAGTLLTNPSLIAGRLVQSAPSIAASVMAGAAAPAGLRALAASGAEGVQAGGGVGQSILENDPAAIGKARLYGGLAGIGTGLIGAAAGKIGGNVEAALASRLAGESAQRLTGSLPARLAKGFAGEGTEEALQSGQETALTNVGTGQPAGQDVAASMLEGGIVGGVAGGAMAGVAGQPAQMRATTPAPVQQQVVEPSAASQTPQAPLPLAQAPQQAAEPPSMLGQDDVKFARKEPAAPPFYSVLERAVTSSKTAKASPEQWAATLKATPGVKGEEMKWSGLDDWLKMQQGPVSKEDVAAFVTGNGVQVEEVELGGTKLPDGWTLRHNPDEGVWEVYGDQDEYQGQGETEEEAIESVQDPEGDETGPRYDRYQLPGGKNYRELLLTLPSVNDSESITKGLEWRKNKHGTWAWYLGDKAVSGFRLTEQEKVAAMGSIDRPGARDSDFKSSHFDQPNILAHVRFNERTDADGKRVLFLEEIQSDWAQKGKRTGFRDVQEKKLAELVARRDELRDLGQDDSLEQLQITQLVSQEPGVPSAPFVGKTDAWVSLALKRMIRYAAENGFDRVAWTNGEQQAERYDLSKQVRSITLRDSDRRLVVHGLNGEKVLSESEVSDSRIADLVGKDVAEKLASATPDYNGVRLVEGDGLKIGGEGMRAFYDKIVPNAAKEIAKKFGGGAVRPIAFEGLGEQAGFEITPEMRSKALGGLPLFAKKDSIPASSPTAATSAPQNTNQGSPKQAKSAASPDKDIARIERLAEAEGWGPATADHPFERVSLPDNAALSAIARALGAEIIGLKLSDGLLAKQRDAYDQFDGLTWRDGKIYIRAESKRPHLTILGHELAHQLRKQRPALYDKVVEAIRPYVDAGKYPDFLKSAVAKDAGSSDAQREEFIGEVFADGFQDTGFWRAVGEKNPSLLKSLIEFLADLIAKIRAAVPSFRAKQYLTDFDKVMKIVGDALGEYATAEQEGSSSPKFARKGSKVSRALTPEQITALTKAGVFYDQPNLKQRTAGLMETFKKSFVQGLVDQFRPIKELSQRAYMLARLSQASDGGLEAMLMYGTPTIDADGAMLVDTEKGGFIPAMQKLEGEHDLFLAWVAANRAEKLKAEGRENLFTDEDISSLQSLNQGDMPSGKSRAQAYSQALAKLQELNKATLDVAQRSGLIDAESRPLWEQEFYVPFYRVVEDGTVGPTKKSGLVNQQSIKKLKGGTQNLGDLMENTLRNWSHLLGASAKNRAALVALNELVKMGGAVESTESSLRSMKKRGAADNVVYVMDAGQQRWFTIEDENMADALMSLERATLPAFLKPFAWFKRLLTFGVTVTPAFKLTNLIRDSIAVIGQTKISANPFKNLKDGWTSMSKDSEVYAQMLAGGGMFRYGTAYEGDRGRHVKRLIESGVPESSVLDSQSKVTALWQKLWDMYQELGDKAENFNRAALYKQLMEKGYTHLEASYMARDVMDFGLQGKWAAVRFLTQVVPFMNARLQGLYKLGRASKEERSRFLWTVAALSTVSIALMMLQDDDEDWKKREDWDRDAFWWLQIGGTAYYIPKPFELGAIGTLAERSVEYFTSEEMTGKRYFKRLGHMLMDTFAMNPMPQAVKPLIDLYSNKDSFTGRPIETLGMDRLQPEDRISSRTSEIAKAGGKAGALSPVQIDHVMRGYLGGLAAGLQYMTDAMLRPALGRPDRPAMRLEEIPLLGRFAKELPSNQSRYVTEFYDTAKQIEEANASYRDALKRGDKPRAQEILENEKPKLLQRKAVAKVREDIGTINRRIKQITDDREMSPMAKRQEIDRLRQLQDSRARSFQQAPK